MKRRRFVGAAAASMAGLAGCMAATEYTIAAVSVQSASPSLDLGVTIRDPDAVVEGPARLEFRLTNVGDGPARIRNTGIWPFGALVLSRADTAEAVRSGPSTPLWTDAYAASDHVEAEGRHSFAVDGTPLTRTLEPGATVSEPYELHGDDIPAAGTYYAYGRFDPSLLEYARPGDDFGPYRPSITVRVEEKPLLPAL